MEHNQEGQARRLHGVISLRDGKAVLIRDQINGGGAPLKSRDGVTQRQLASYSIQIDKGIPIPRKNTAGRSVKYWIDWVRKMEEVGDSFYMQGYSRTEVHGKLKYWKEATGYEFTTRTVVGGVRVWRTK